MTSAKNAKAARREQASTPNKQVNINRRRNITLIVALVVTVLTVCGAIINFAVHSASSTKAAQSQTPTHMTNYAYTVGQANAKITFDIYEDFQCPALQELRSWQLRSDYSVGK